MIMKKTMKNILCLVMNYNVLIKPENKWYSTVLTPNISQNLKKLMIMAELDFSYIILSSSQELPLPMSLTGSAI